MDGLGDVEEEEGDDGLSEWCVSHGIRIKAMFALQMVAHVIDSPGV